MFCLSHFTQTLVLSPNNEFSPLECLLLGYKPNKIVTGPLLALRYAAGRREVHTDGDHVGLISWPSQSLQ